MAGVVFRTETVGDGKKLARKLQAPRVVTGNGLDQLVGGRRLDFRDEHMLLEQPIIPSEQLQRSVHGRCLVVYLQER